MKIAIWEFINAFIAKHLWRLLNRYQVVLKLEDQVVVDVPLLSVMDYKKFGLFDMSNKWHLSIVKKEEGAQ